ncbi:MAG: DUF4198 domain-containing protein [Steroidobacteraceae bacterium]|nr:DUF4198 domain-containing protein [Steroidobacteraceae bacterium]
MKIQHRTARIGAALVAAALTLAAVPASAHQTFLIADINPMRPGTDNFLILRNGTYHESGYSITRAMSRDISIVMGGKRRTPDASDVADVDGNPSYKSTFIKVVADPEGTGLAGVAAKPDYIALPAEMFANYLKHDGLADMLKDFTATNKLSTIRERYTKHAKAVFQVGTPLTDDYNEALGYKVELFLDRHPGKVKAGEDMSFRVMYEGKPLANQIVYVSHASRPVDPKADVPASSLYTLRTDADGRASFKVTTADKWFIQLIHMQKMDDGEVDYESNWSTITFEIK